MDEDGRRRKRNRATLGRRRFPRKRIRRCSSGSLRPKCNDRNHWLIARLPSVMPFDPGSSKGVRRLNLVDHKYGLRVQMPVRFMVVHGALRACLGPLANRNPSCHTAEQRRPQCRYYLRRAPNFIQQIRKPSSRRPLSDWKTEQGPPLSATLFFFRVDLGMNPDPTTQQPEQIVSRICRLYTLPSSQSDAQSHRCTQNHVKLA